MKVYNITITSTDSTQVTANSEEEAEQIAMEVFNENPNNNADLDTEWIGFECNDCKEPTGNMYKCDNCIHKAKVAMVTGK